MFIHLGVILCIVDIHQADIGQWSNTLASVFEVPYVAPNRTVSDEILKKINKFFKQHPFLKDNIEMTIQYCKEYWGEEYIENYYARRRLDGEVFRRATKEADPFWVQYYCAKVGGAVGTPSVDVILTSEIIPAKPARGLEHTVASLYQELTGQYI